MNWRRRKRHIGAHLYTISRVKRSHPELKGADGATDFSKCCIWLASDLEGDALEDALLHEVTHVVKEVSGAKNVLRDVAATEEAVDRVDELMVRAETPVWHRLLKDLGFSLIQRIGSE